MNDFSKIIGLAVVTLGFAAVAWNWITTLQEQARIRKPTPKVVTAVGYGPANKSNLKAETKNQLIRNLESIQKTLKAKGHVSRGEIFLSNIGDEQAIEKNIQDRPMVILPLHEYETLLARAERQDKPSGGEAA